MNLAVCKELVIEKVDILEVMKGYNVRFSFSPDHAKEAQYHCPWHSGKDTKPSARLYVETKSTWCWVCHKRRDVIQIVMEEEQLPYAHAIDFLMTKYGIKAPDDIDPEKRKEVGNDRLDILQIRLGVLKNSISALKHDNRFTTEQLAALVVSMHSLMFKASKRNLDDYTEIMSGIKKIEDKITEVKGRATYAV